MRQIYTICFGQCGKYLNSFSLFPVTNLWKSVKLMRIRAIATDFKQKNGRQLAPGKVSQSRGRYFEERSSLLTWPG